MTMSYPLKISCAKRRHPIKSITIVASTLIPPNLSKHIPNISKTLQQTQAYLYSYKRISNNTNMTFVMLPIHHFPIDLYLQRSVFLFVFCLLAFHMGRRTGVDSISDSSDLKLFKLFGQVGLQVAYHTHTHRHVYNNYNIIPVNH